MAESDGPLGVDADVVPGGAGPFGYTRINPVPVAGNVWERVCTWTACAQRTVCQSIGGAKVRKLVKMVRLTATN